MFDKAIAQSLFADLDKHWISDPANYGMRRPSYSPEEEEAAQFFISRAKQLELPVYRDKAGNYYIILEGKDPLLPAIVSGSHLDSVPQGGKYDGPAGVVAAFSVLAAFKKNGIVPLQTLCTMVVRGEESAWFGQVSIGAKLAIGDLTYEKLASLHRNDVDMTLAKAMQDLGLNPAALKDRALLFPVDETACFMELHIEQGPFLMEKQIPVGIVTGIRGNIRYREIYCLGEAGHTGTVPHHMRKDAVRASIYLLSKLEEVFNQLQQQGMDIVFTFPIATTGQGASLTTIPSKFSFAIEVRSQSQDVLAKCEHYIAEYVKQTEQLYRVQFNVPVPIKSAPAVMDNQVQSQLAQSTKKLGLPEFSLPSGAGHDTAIFSNAGIPSGMIFVRHNGISHNPLEDTPFEDFSLATDVLAEFMLQGLAKDSSKPKRSFTEALLYNGAQII